MASQYDPSTGGIDFLRSSTVFSGLDPESFNALAAVLRWDSFDEGEVLFNEGDPGDRFFVVLHGRLAISRHSNEKDTLIGWVMPGESVGELALMEDQTRTATVSAYRATVTVSLRRQDYETLTKSTPQCLVLLNRLLTMRLRQVMTAGAKQQVSAEILAVVAASKDAPLPAFTEGLCRCLQKEGPVLHLPPGRLEQLVGADADRGKLLTWLNEQEKLYRFIVLEADIEDTPWTERCLRHGDRVLLIARANAKPGALMGGAGSPPPEHNGVARPRLLILIQDDKAAMPKGTKAWLDAVPVTDHHHLRMGVEGDIERLGRFLRGKSVSLALAGGAALGFAHIGVMRALKEAGIPVDLVCGTSMGSILGGQVAFGMSWEDIQRETRKHFRGNSVYDYTLPVISLCKAQRMDERLRMVVGDVAIEDLWLKFFCVSTNLTKASQEVHESGTLVRAMRASSAIPGLFPPIKKDTGDMLVDGALVNNLPADIAAQKTGGAVIAVNVIPTVDKVTTAGYVEGASAFSVIMSRRKKIEAEQSPVMADLLLRSVFLQSVSAAEKIRTRASVYIEPPLEGFTLLNTFRFDEIVEVGYKAAVEKLATWTPAL